MKQTIFNILCKAWFSQHISLVIKSLVLPFFVTMTKEEALSCIEDVSPALARSITTEGVVNLLPVKVNRLLHPRIRKIRNPSESSTDEIERRELVIRPAAEAGIPPQETVVRKIKASGSLLSHMMGQKFKHLEAAFTHRSLGVTFVTGGLILLLQVVVSDKARVWSKVGVRFLLFLGSFGAFGVSLLGILLKMINSEKKQGEDEKKPIDADFVEHFDFLHSF